MSLKPLLLTAALSLLTSNAAIAGGTYETIAFIKDDLKSGLEYKNIRYTYAGSKGLYMEQGFDRNSMTYIKPDNYTWTKESLDGKLHDQLSFQDTNNYAYLRSVNPKSYWGLSPTNDGDMYLGIDGGACIGDGCSLDENIISVVLPKKYKLVAYESHERKPYNDQYEYNANANIKLIDNTLTLYTSNVKGAYLKLWFIDTSNASDIYKNVSDSLKQFSEISVSNTGTETKIMMPMDNVFASGKAQVKELGKKWLNALVQTLNQQKFKEIRVEGHSDSIPINSTMYPSNWELSSARASDAVRYMIQQGIDQTKVAAVGYADTRPLVDNSTKENRSKNRRIEITVVADDGQN